MKDRKVHDILNDLSYRFYNKNYEAIIDFHNNEYKKIFSDFDSNEKQHYFVLIGASYQELGNLKEADTCFDLYIEELTLFQADIDEINNKNGNIKLNEESIKFIYLMEKLNTLGVTYKVNKEDYDSYHRQKCEQEKKIYFKENFLSKFKPILFIPIIGFITYFISLFTGIKQIDFLLMIAIISPALVLNEIFYTHQVKGLDSIKSKIFLKNIESLKGFGLIFPFLLLFLIYKFFMIHGFLLTSIFLVSVGFIQSFYYYYLLQYIKNELLIFSLSLIPLLLFTKISI